MICHLLKFRRKQKCLLNDVQIVVVVPLHIAGLPAAEGAAAVAAADTP